MEYLRKNLNIVRNLSAVALMMALAVMLAGPQSASAEVINGVWFPDGASSFADQFVAYQPYIEWDPSVPGNQSPSADYRDPNAALGVPDYTTPAPGQPHNTGEFVSLGNGGSITLEFTDNALNGSGDSSADLYIFEAGLPEAMFVEISADGQTWISLGLFMGNTIGIDIDAFGLGIVDVFHYVRLTDDASQWPDAGYGGLTSGCDIDAVGAIYTTVPEPAALTLLGIGGVFLAIRRRRRNKHLHGKHNSSKGALNLMLVLTIALAVVLVGSQSASAEVINGVWFPDGAASFADQFTAYQPYIEWDPSSQGNQSPSADYRDPNAALGVPDYTTPAPGQTHNTGEFVSLGNGGSITLQFTDNALNGSGDSGADLYIFEAGLPEAMFVEISADGQTWVSLGLFMGNTIGIDIDAFGLGIADVFHYVRLTDDASQWPDAGYGGLTSGCDIDAVGAIYTVPEPAALMFLGLGGVFLAIRKRRKNNHSAKKHNGNRAIINVILALVIIFSAATATQAAAGKWYTNPDTGETVYVPDAANAFATAVVDSNIVVEYVKSNGTPDGADDTLGTPTDYDYMTPLPQHRNPNDALGEANYTGHAPGVPYNADEFVCLGNGGSITLHFGNKDLTCGGNSKDDLWIFEIGDKVEAMDVEISADGNTWYRVGSVGGATKGVDIDAYAGTFGGVTAFHYVRLTDDPNLWPAAGQYGLYAGADIDGVAIIPEPAALTLLGIGFAAMMIRKRSQKSQRNHNA